VSVGQNLLSNESAAWEVGADPPSRSPTWHIPIRWSLHIDCVESSAWGRNTTTTKPLPAPTFFTAFLVLVAQAHQQSSQPYSTNLNAKQPHHGSQNRHHLRMLPMPIDPSIDDATAYFHLLTFTFTSTPCMAISRHWQKPRRRASKRQVEQPTSTSEPQPC